MNLVEGTAAYSRKQIAAFIGVGIGPLCALYGVVLLGLLLNVMIMLTEPEDYGQSALDIIGVALGLLSILVIGVLVAGYLCGKTKSWFVRCGVLYLLWLLLVSPICFVVSASMAGVSMAAVDGATNGAELLVQEIRFAFVLLAVGHVIIIPWVGITSIVFRKRLSP